MKNTILKILTIIILILLIASALYVYILYPVLYLLFGIGRPLVG